MDPGVGHVGADDRKRRILGDHRLGEIIERAEMELNPGQASFGLPPQVVDIGGGRWPVVVAGHHHGQIVLARPARRLLQARTILGGVVAENAGTVRTLPPEKRRHLDGEAGAIAAELQELDAGMRQQRRPDPGVAGNIGHLAGNRQRPAILPGQLRRDAESAHQILEIVRLRMQGEGQRMEGDGALADRLLDAHLAGRILPRPEHMGERPAGQRPGEPLFRRPAVRGLDDLERAVHHRLAVFPEHVLDRLGVADVEMGLEDHPDMFVFHGHLHDRVAGLGERGGGMDIDLGEQRVGQRRIRLFGRAGRLQGKRQIAEIAELASRVADGHAMLAAPVVSGLIRA